ncbi:hypothetical protein [Spiroplasma alleghenense]|uniref:Uncharacterized protein n=1 Tax=Spiroplasma alleghenense TaxID=216931 RepID=A0A345Z2Q5_9MOLU|nr:hypothetical protein [Spiroplasma alleghenense]AXK50884.1 hypothetical protein SALLE_v1c02080 [Spiroplasma alleghenense]
MAKELKSVKILDQKVIEENQIEFEKNREEINKQVYTSVIEERARVKKIICRAKIKKEIESVFHQYLNITAKDLHPNLEVDQLEEGGFYVTSKSKNRITFLVKKLEINKEIMVEWFSKDQWFTRTIVFSSNSKNNVTKIKYMDISKGKRSIAGFMERHVAGVYTKRQQLAFIVSMFQLKIDLGIYPKSKIPAIEKRMERALNYSRELY